jgi:hypothetical protein
VSWQLRRKCQFSYIGAPGLPHQALSKCCLGFVGRADYQILCCSCWASEHKYSSPLKSALCWCSRNIGKTLVPQDLSPFKGHGQSDQRGQVQHRYQMAASTRKIVIWVLGNHIFWGKLRFHWLECSILGLQFKSRCSQGNISKIITTRQEKSSFLSSLRSLSYDLLTCRGPVFLYLCQGYTKSQQIRTVTELTLSGSSLLKKAYLRMWVSEYGVHQL